MPRYNTVLTIDLAALTHNLGIFKSKVGPAVKTAAVVKANGYGLGLETIVPVLDQAGTDAFYVANLDEGVRARSCTTKPIFILGGFTDQDDVPAMAIQNLTPVVNTIDQIHIIRARGIDLPFSLHLDTGMNRLGLSTNDIEYILARPDLLRGLNLIQIMSHFACSDERDHAMNIIQAEKFSVAIKKLREAIGRDIPASLSNSSGVFRSASFHHDMIRPGFGLYGGNPTPETQNPMRDVVQLQSRILQVRSVRRGDTVGYNATHRFDHDATLLTIGTGYADGVLRALSNRGTVYFGDVACKIVGRVSMDLISIEWPTERTQAHLPHLGDLIDIIGPHQTVDHLAISAGTIGYEILTQLSTRAERVVIPSP